MPETMWTPETMMRLRRVSQPRVSPDGRRVAFAVRETRMDADRSEYHTQIWTARARGGEEQQLTRGEASAHDPQWSPDGAQIAFRAARGGGRRARPADQCAHRRQQLPMVARRGADRLHRSRPPHTRGGTRRPGEG
jgi:dipeptidyl aminopeptidase/acylaminoacyl peptidase